MEIFPESSLRISIFAHYEKLIFKAKCLLNGTLNAFPINAEEDKLKMILKDLDVYILLKGYFYVPSIGNKKHFKLEDVHVVKNHLLNSIEFSLEHDNVSTMSDHQNAYLHRNTVALWQQIEPDLRTAATTFIRTIANKVFDNYPAQQLFHAKLGVYFSF